jgi:hypothetical protein
MINLSFLKFISKEISDFTRNTILETNLVWSNIIDQDGSVTVPANSVAITLVKIEKESVVNKSNTIYKDVGYGVTMPSLNINLFLQFAAHNRDYGEALKQLGFILSYFQSHPVLTRQDTPGLTEPGVDKLIFEIVNYSHQELSNLWSQLGAKYIPSVVYKMRMIIIDEYSPVIAPAITKIAGTLDGKN